MKYLKEYRSEEYPYFEIDPHEYSYNIENCHKNMSSRDIDEIVLVVYSKRRDYWYHTVADGYAVNITNSTESKLYTVFLNDDNYYYVWSRMDGRFFKCDELLGFKSLVEDTFNLTY
jgi:Cys-tRNA synthase (O-phospho-L-seryl-tRNA:Cys-tRNA synthase)